MPDLTIYAGYSWSVIGSNVTNGTGTLYNVVLNGNVINNGNATASASTTRFTIGGLQINRATGSVNPGQSLPLYNNNFQLISGSYNATVTADVLGSVQESNE